MRIIILALAVLGIASFCLAAGTKPSAHTVSVISPQGKPVTEYQTMLVAETKKSFQEAGYTVVSKDADYNVVTDIAEVQADKKFSPLGCLACGIWGAAKPKATATVSTLVTNQQGEKIFSNSVTSTSEGSELFGIFKGTTKEKESAIKSCIKQLYSAFFIQHPA